MARRNGIDARRAAVMDILTRLNPLWSKPLWTKKQHKELQHELLSISAKQHGVSSATVRKWIVDFLYDQFRSTADFDVARMDNNVKIKLFKAYCNSKGWIAC